MKLKRERKLRRKETCLKVLISMMMVYEVSTTIKLLLIASISTSMNKERPKFLKRYLEGKVKPMSINSYRRQSISPRDNFTSFAQHRPKNNLSIVSTNRAVSYLPIFISNPYPISIASITEVFWS